MICSFAYLTFGLTAISLFLIKALNRFQEDHKSEHYHTIDYIQKGLELSNGIVRIAVFILMLKLYYILERENKRSIIMII